MVIVKPHVDPHRIFQGDSSMTSKDCARRHRSIRQAPSRAFRPSICNNESGARLETRTLAAWSFYGIGTVGTSQAIARSFVAPADQALLAVNTQGAGPAPGGATASSSLQNTIQRRPVFNPPFMTWFDQIVVSESGYASSTITGNATNSYIASIQIHNVHQHTDQVTVNDPGPFWVGGVSVDTPRNAQWTTLGSTPYTWATHDELGNFNPNWTVTVTFSLNIEPTSPGFQEAAQLNITSTQMVIKLGTGLFQASVPELGGGGGLLITAPGGAVLDQVPGFADGNYFGQWTFPASQLETVQYGSQFLTGPSGNFSYGTSISTEGFSYDFSVTLNS